MGLGGVENYTATLGAARHANASLAQLWRSGQSFEALPQLLSALLQAFYFHHLQTIAVFGMEKCVDEVQSNMLSQLPAAVERPPRRVGDTEKFPAGLRAHSLQLVGDNGPLQADGKLPFSSKRGGDVAAEEEIDSVDIADQFEQGIVVDTVVGVRRISAPTCTGNSARMRPTRARSCSKSLVALTKMRSFSAILDLSLPERDRMYLCAEHIDVVGNPHDYCR